MVTTVLPLALTCIWLIFISKNSNSLNYMTSSIFQNQKIYALKIIKSLYGANPSILKDLE